MIVRFIKFFWRIEIFKNCLFYYFFVGVYMCVWFMEDFDENDSKNLINIFMKKKWLMIDLFFEILEIL